MQNVAQILMNTPFFKEEINTIIDLCKERRNRIRGKYKQRIREEWYDLDEHGIKDKIRRIDKDYQYYDTLITKLARATQEFLG